MNEPSLLARATLRRYRDAISPSAAQRDALVHAVIARVEAAPVGASVPATAAARVPWLVLVGVAVLGVAISAWAAREPVAAPMSRGLGELVVDVAPPAAIASAPAQPPSTPAAVVAAPQREPAAPRTRAPRTPARGVTPAAADRPAPPPAMVDEEVRLLREANLALRGGDPLRARARLDEHAQRFPDGQLVELRELGYALLRCASAESDETTSIVDAFSRRFPGSLHLARLKRECPGPR